MARISLRLLCLALCVTVAMQASLREHHPSAALRDPTTTARRRALRYQPVVSEPATATPDDSADVDRLSNVSLYMTKLYNRLRNEDKYEGVPPVGQNENTIRSLPTVGSKRELSEHGVGGWSHCFPYTRIACGNFDWAGLECNAAASPPSLRRALDALAA